MRVVPALGLAGEVSRSGSVAELLAAVSLGPESTGQKRSKSAVPDLAYLHGVALVCAGRWRPDRTGRRPHAGPERHAARRRAEGAPWKK